MVSEMGISTRVKSKILDPIVSLLVGDMMNYLRTFKTSSEALGHHQTVFQHVPILIGHRKERIIRRKVDLNVALSRDTPSAFPPRVLVSPLISGLPRFLRSARRTSGRLRLSISDQNPPLFSTVGAREPNVRVRTLMSDLFRRYDISCFHIMNVSWNCVNYNG